MRNFFLTCFLGLVSVMLAVELVPHQVVSQSVTIGGVSAGFSLTGLVTTVLPSMTLLPGSVTSGQVTNWTATTTTGVTGKILRIGTSYSASGINSGLSGPAFQTFMLWLSKINGDVSGYFPTGPGITLTDPVTSITTTYFLAIEYTNDDSSGQLTQIVYEGLAASNRYPILISAYSPAAWPKNWGRFNQTVFALVSTVCGIFNRGSPTPALSYCSTSAPANCATGNCPNTYAYGHLKDTAVGIYHDRVIPYVTGKVKNIIVYGAAGAASTLTSRFVNAITSTAALTGSINTTVVRFSWTPTTTIATDTQTLQDMFTGKFTGINGVSGVSAGDYDMIVYLALNGDEIAACNALRNTGFLPKIAFIGTTLSTTAQFQACEGWMSTVNYDVSIPRQSTIPGTIWQTNTDFQKDIKAKFNISTSFPHGQGLAVVESIMAGLHAAQSFDRDLLFAGMMSLNGTTAYNHLRLNPLTNLNDALEFNVFQVQKGALTYAPSLAQAVFPVQWDWRPVPLPWWEGPSKGVQNGLIAISVIGIVFVVASIGFLLLFRHSPVVKAFTLMFTLLIAGGLILGFLSVIVSTIYPVTADTCRATLVLAHLSFALMYGALISRSYRISAIFHQKIAKVVSLSNARMFAQIMGVVALLGIYFAVWFNVDAVGPRADDIYVNNGTQYVTCHAADSSWSTALLVIEGVTLLTGVYYALRNRNTPIRFNETAFIAGTIYNTAVISAMAIGLVHTVLEVPSSSTPLVGGAMVFVLFVTWGLMICSQVVTAIFFRMDGRPILSPPTKGASNGTAINNSIIEDELTPTISHAKTPTPYMKQKTLNSAGIAVSGTTMAAEGTVVTAPVSGYHKTVTTAPQTPQKERPEGVPTAHGSPSSGLPGQVNEDDTTTETAQVTGPPARYILNESAVGETDSVMS